MPNSLRSFAALVLPLAAFAAVGCQSPWQSGTPVAGDSGWFSWLTASERSGDPLERLAGGGSYTPGVAEADSSAERSRQQLYGARTSELDLSAGTATNPEGLASQNPSPETLDQALPQAEDDAAARVAQSLRSRFGGTASPAVAEQAVSQSPYDGAVAPAGYQAPEASQPPGGATVISPVASAPRAYVDTAPSDAEKNPFYDPFGDRRQVSASSSAYSTSSPAATTKPPSTGSSALRLLTTPPASEEPSSPTLSVPNGSSSASGSLLKLLGENPLREGAPAASGN